MKRFSLLSVVLMTGAVVAGTAACATAEEEAHESVALPAAARAALEKQMPGGQIGAVEMETMSIQVFEVEVTVDGAKRDAVVTADGTILEIEGSADPKTAPAQVGAQLRRAGHGAKLKTFEKIQVLAELVAVPLKQPRSDYEAGFIRGGHESEFRWTAAGTLVASPSIGEDDDEHADDDDGDGDSEHADSDDGDDDGEHADSDDDDHHHGNGDEDDEDEDGDND